jgi:oxygen-independent coproporphyrinogen-3 oxidase
MDDRVWREHLTWAVDLSVPHLSIYGLTVEPRTILSKMIRDGVVTVPDQDATGGMFLDAMEVLEASGYRQYEISNFALPGFESKHNIGYWNHSNVLGFGPSAHSFWQDGSARRWSNVRSIRRYNTWKSREDIVDQSELLDSHHLASEYVMLGLRRSEGIKRAILAGRYSIEISAATETFLQGLVAERLVEDDGEQIVLTRRGKLVADAVTVELAARAIRE